MRDAKLLGDLPKVARSGIPVLHHTRATDYFQVSDFGEVGKDFILDTIGEEGVLFITAQILERQNSDRAVSARQRLPMLIPPVVPT